jgi:hypothetical protein
MLSELAVFRVHTADVITAFSSHFSLLEGNLL